MMSRLGAGGGGSVCVIVSIWQRQHSMVIVGYYMILSLYTHN